MCGACELLLYGTLMITAPGGRASIQFNHPECAAEAFDKLVEILTKGNNDDDTTAA